MQVIMEELLNRRPVLRCAFPPVPEQVKKPVHNIMQAMMEELLEKRLTLRPAFGYRSVLSETLHPIPTSRDNDILSLPNPNSAHHGAPQIFIRLDISLGKRAGELAGATYLSKK